MPRTGLFVIGVFLLCLALAACGKKAGQVDAPPDVIDDKYPLVYPDPKTDPAPTYSPGR